MNKLSVTVLLLFDVGLSIHVSQQRNVSLCEVSACLRKCCPKGQYLLNKTCRATEAAFNFSDVGLGFDVLVQDGIVVCGEDQERYMLDETDEFYIQDNDLVWPLLNLTLSYVYYCIDMIDDLTTSKALICYGTVLEENKLVFYSGNVSLKI